VILSASNAADETIRYARSRNVTKVVVGKPTHASVWDRLRPSFLDRMVRASGAIDVYVIRRRKRSGAETERALRSRSRPLPSRSSPAATSVVVATTISCRRSAAAIGRRGDGLFAGHRLGLAAFWLRAVAAGSGVSVLCFDFFFIPPLYTFAVRDLSHVVTFGVMFMVALVISGLTQRVRAQAGAAGQREQRTASLYALSRELAATKQVEDIARIARATSVRRAGRGRCLTRCRILSARSLPRCKLGGAASRSTNKSRASPNGFGSTSAQRGSVRTPCPRREPCTYCWSRHA